MEGQYNCDGNPIPGLVEVVREANGEIYDRATKPCGTGSLADSDEKLCRSRNEIHKHVQ